LSDDRDVAELFVAADLVTPMALRVAATLRLADHLAAGASAAGTLADAVGADADALDRLLHHLAVVGVVERAADGGYSLTARGHVLRDDHESGLRRVLDAEGSIGRGDLAFVQLLHSVRSGAAAFPVQFGEEFWSDLARDPARTADYDAQMGRDVRAWAPAVLAALDWSAYRHVMDVGGGNGTLLAVLLREHPALCGTVFDQPATAAGAHGTLAAAGLADRGSVVGGSFFDPLPRGADVYLLCAVLHDWDDARAGAILQRCADAAGPGGRVVVVEKTGAEGASPSTAMDLRVLVYFGGRERDVDALTALATDVGMTLRSLHRDGDLSVLTFSAG
jgi:hypothetical protein